MSKLMEYLQAGEYPESFEEHALRVRQLSRDEDEIMYLDLDSHGRIVISDPTGYRLVLNPVGRTAELLAKILIERKMGRKRLGEGGAPTQAQVPNLSAQVEALRQRKIAEAKAGLPAVDVELDL